jgi:hypothetical protein
VLLPWQEHDTEAATVDEVVTFDRLRVQVGALDAVMGGETAG